MTGSLRANRRIDRRRRRNRRRVAFWVLGSLAFLILAAGIIALLIVPKALGARDGLEAAIPTVSEVQQKVLAGDTAGAQAAADELIEVARTAHEDTSGWLWQALEWVPVAGSNLKAVRLATAAVDELATGAVRPIADLSPATLAPVDGRVDIASIQAVVTTIEGVAASVQSATTLMADVDRNLLVGPVGAGVERIDRALAQVDAVLTPALPAVRQLPAMLGADGPRDVLVIFQNNGEVMPGGGTIGSLAQVHIDNGAVSVVAQSSASGRDMAQYTTPVVPVAQDAYDFYGFGIGTHVQSLTKTPRFDLTFEIAREMWRLKTGAVVDAVVAIDTVALSYLLVATGPVVLPDGLEIANANAVPLLLGDLYYSYPPEQVDIINQAFAAFTLQKLLSGDVDIAKLVSVIGLSIEEGRIRVWSSREEEQQLIIGTGIDKRGPTSSGAADAMGVYFIDWTPGKMQRFMTQAIDVAQATCGEQRRVRVTVTLTNTLDPSRVSGLPEYVTGNGVATPKGTMRLDAAVYSPTDFELIGVTLDGVYDAPRVGTDGAFHAVAQPLTLAPGQSRTVVFDYVAHTDSTDVELDITPVVTPTTLTDGVLECPAA